MTKIATFSSTEVNDNFKFYALCSKTNIVVPIAVILLIAGLAAVYKWLLGLSPGFTMYFGVPVFLFLLAMVLLISCWLIKMIGNWWSQV